MAYSPEQRSYAIKTVIAGLSKGTPLTVLCAVDDMPGLRTFYEWMNSDADLSASIARAREAGFDQIALDALSIADETSNDTVQTEHGEKANAEWISRSKLRVETRLKLLAKWDPKRYGDKIAHVGGEDGDKPIQTATVVTFVRPGESM